MTANGWLQFVVFFAVLLLLMRPLGLYIARVLEGKRLFSTQCSGLSNGSFTGRRGSTRIRK